MQTIECYECGDRLALDAMPEAPAEVDGWLRINDDDSLCPECWDEATKLSDE